MVKLISFICLVALLLGGYIYVDRQGYNRGYNSALAAQNEAIKEYQARITGLMEETVKWKQEQEIKTNAKIDQIKRAKGLCLDARIEPDDLLLSLRND